MRYTNRKTKKKQKNRNLHTCNQHILPLLQVNSTKTQNIAHLRHKTESMKSNKFSSLFKVEYIKSKNEFRFYQLENTQQM